MLHNNKLGSLDVFEYLSNCKLKIKKEEIMYIKKKLFCVRSVSYKRGLATVVTSAIILSAVSIMGVMMLSWSNSTLLTKQMEIEEVFSTQINKINEDLFFENIWFATPSGGMNNNYLNVTLSNIGILGLNVTTIRVTNVTAGNNTNNVFDYPEGGDYTDMGIIKSATISKNVTYPWQSGDELNVLVFTNRGNQFITQVVAP